MQAGWSRRERDALWALARACLPRGTKSPAASTETIGRLEAFIEGAPASWGVLFRGALAWIDADARLTYGRTIPRLNDQELLDLVRSLFDRSYAARARAKLVVGALKLSHFSTASAYQALGCAFDSLPPNGPSRSAPGPSITDGGAIASGEVIRCDVVVIGTGAGGAVVAKELAERGANVCVLEEGEYFEPRDFTGPPLARQARMYRQMGVSFALGNAPILLPTGRTVGGTTTINSGTCLRPPARVHRTWSRRLGLAGLDQEALAPAFARVETILGVAPSDPRALGGVARVIARGCDALGYQHGPLPRNAPGCDGRGTCTFGCPTGAKRSTNVSYVPMAIAAGARVFTGARVMRVLQERGRAAGVLVKSTRGEWRVSAPVVVVACGALETPLLLARSGLGGGSRQLGRNLFIHPSVFAAAEFDETIDNAHSVPQGYAFHGFEDDGIRFAGVFAPLELSAAMFPFVGEQLVGVLESFDRLAGFGAMIEDVPSGRVLAGPGGQPIVMYRTTPDVTARMQRSLGILARVYFAAGARRVFPLVARWSELRSIADVERFEQARLQARDFDIAAYHPGGTARMGQDARTGVVDASHELYGTRDVYVVDASVFPSSPAVNPQLTIMSLATRAAGIIAGRLS